MGTVAIVRYSEIALKGRNRSTFEQQLVKNIRSVLPESRVTRRPGRIIVRGDEEVGETVRSRLAKIFGIQNFSVAEATDYDIENIARLSIKTAKEHLQSGRSSFKVSTKREFKKFPLKSMELSAMIGERVLKVLPQLRVDVKNPDFIIGIEVRSDGVFVFPEKLQGPGGLPTGVSGKGVLLLSGGIDSPVAGYLAMKRGISLLAVHFSSPPYTGVRSLNKVRDLARIMASYSENGTVELLNIAFTDCQIAVKKAVPDKLSLVIQRRIMMRVASRVAESEKAEVLVTGENVGQVASQTLKNMAVIDEVSPLLVIRPLICFDKLETIELARKIGTYDTSALPYEDSCTVFIPAEPATGSSRAGVKDAENSLNVDELVSIALGNLERETITEDGVS